MVTFRPDGAAWRARIGLVIPHFATVSETEMQVLLPEGVSLHVSRAPLGLIDPGAQMITQIGLDGAQAMVNGAGLKAAATRLSTVRTAAAIYGFCASSYVQTREEEDQLSEQLSLWLGGAPAILMARAMVQAVKAFGRRNVALIHPPWYRPELCDLGTAYFESHDISVVDNARADLARTFSELEPRAVYSWVSARVPDHAEAAVLCGGGFRAIGAIDALEERLGRPVVSANQAALWAALRRAGIEDRIEGYGALFDQPGYDAA